MGCCGGGEAKKDPKKIEASDLWNQRLAAWRPMFTPIYFISFLAVIGVAFVTVGVFVLDASDAVVEQEVRYGGLDDCKAALQQSPCASSEDPADPLCWRGLNDTEKAEYANTCDVTITVLKAMAAPVYFYYELDEFYQNQRVYVKSQAPLQLRGDDFASKTDYADYLRKSCVDSNFDKCTSGEVKVLNDPSHYYCNPCGLVARSFFTDEFQLSSRGAEVVLHKDGVAWPRDVAEKFLATDSKNAWNRRTPAENALVTDPDFIVWMRTAALPDFRKLRGIITEDLAEGQTLTLTVYNNYDLSRFGGEKKVVLSTMSWIGGKNSFLGSIYIVVGALCLFLSVLFVAIELLAKKKRQ